MPKTWGWWHEMLKGKQLLREGSNSDVMRLKDILDANMEEVHNLRLKLSALN